jgi:hypothetical protein
VVDPEHFPELIAASDHPAAVPVPPTWWETAFRGGARDLWCLTTTTRRIPCRGREGAIMFADWEEIESDDRETLRSWYDDVWQTLNGTDSTPTRPSPQVLAAETGLSPNCLVACEDWRGGIVWRRIADIGVGARVFDAMGSKTTVVGKVWLEGDQATDAVEIPSPEHGPQFVSCATWIQQTDGAWSPAGGGGFAACEMHPSHWEHLYTESGSFMISGGWKVRDASDVGLAHLKPLVERNVLTNK